MRNANGKINICYFDKNVEEEKNSKKLALSNCRSYEAANWRRETREIFETSRSTDSRRIGRKCKQSYRCFSIRSIEGRI